MGKTIIKYPYRIILLIAISFLLIKNLLLAILLGDFPSLVPAAFHLLLIYLISKKIKYTEHVIRAWAVIYLIVFTGIKAGAKTLIILRGDSWEIDPLRYYIDVALVAIGVLVVVFDSWIFEVE